MKTLILSAFLALFTTQCYTQPAPPEPGYDDPSLKPALVDFEGFMRLADTVSRYRQDRLVDLQTFHTMALEEDVIILDTRSESMYRMKHVKGAIHLNFSDFTEEKLAKVIPSKNTKVLIYCNNNFQGDPAYFAAKSMPLALNIPTFINLYGYGYRNIYELEPLVPIDSGLMAFEGEGVGN